MAVDVQHLRTTDPNRAPANLEIGQIAFGLGQSPIADICRAETHHDIFLYVGNGSDDRIDSNGNDLSSLITTGLPVANKGWIRYSLVEKLVQGNWTVTGDACVGGDLTINGILDFSGIACPLIVNCDTGVASQLLASAQFMGTPSVDIFGDQINVGVPTSFIYGVAQTGTLLSLVHDGTTRVDFTDLNTIFTNDIFTINNTVAGQALRAENGFVIIADAYSLPNSSPTEADRIIISTSSSESDWTDTVDGGEF